MTDDNKVVSMFDMAGKAVWEHKVFPEGLCTVQNAREPSVQESTEKFLCFLVDSRFKEQARLLLLTPYTCPDSEDGTTLYGWSDGPNVYDHFEQNIHDDSEVVTAWSKIGS